MRLTTKEMLLGAFIAAGVCMAGFELLAPLRDFVYFKLAKSIARLFMDHGFVFANAHIFAFVLAAFLFFAIAYLFALAAIFFAEIVVKGRARE